MPDRNNRSNLGEQVDSRDAANQSGRSSMNESMDESTAGGHHMHGSQRQGEGRASSTEVDRENMRSSSRPGGEGRADRGSSERTSARNATADQADGTAGDEGLDSVEHMRHEGGSVTQRGASRTSSGNVDPGAEPGSFSGRGAQSGGSQRNAEGTGYSSDRSGQLQDDNAMSGSQGRHGRSGSRHGQPATGTSDAERKGGQTAQNPRSSGSSRSSNDSSKSGSDDIDRSVM